MCKMSKIENMGAINDKPPKSPMSINRKNSKGLSAKVASAATTAEASAITRRNSNLSSAKAASANSNAAASNTDNSNSNSLPLAAVNGRVAAFPGSKFDKSGYCLHHPTVQIVNPIRGDSGKLLYQELRPTCPSCQSAKHRMKRNTSLGGGKVRSGHKLHGAAAAPTVRSRSRSRSRPRDGGDRQRVAANHVDARLDELNGANGGGPPARARSRSRGPSGKSRSRVQYDTPFDDKGRCHYHKNVQLAAKKMTGEFMHEESPRAKKY